MLQETGEGTIGTMSKKLDEKKPVPSQSLADDKTAVFLDDDEHVRHQTRPLELTLRWTGFTSFTSLRSGPKKGFEPCNYGETTDGLYLNDTIDPLSSPHLVYCTEVS